MAIQEASKNYFDYARGIVTEASPLNFPEGASLDEENFDLQRSRVRRRRQPAVAPAGASVIAGAAYGGPDASNAVAYEWRNASGTGENWLVYLNGKQAKFLRNYPNTLAPSGLEAVELELEERAEAVADPDFNAHTDYQVQVAEVGGELYVVSPSLSLQRISLEGEGAFTTTVIEAIERDLEGLEASGTPLVLRPAHEYNLRNQGWGQFDVTTSQYLYDKFSAATNNTDNSYPTDNDNPNKGWYIDNTGKRVWDYDEFETHNTGGAAEAPKGAKFLPILNQRRTNLFNKPALPQSRTITVGTSLASDGLLTIKLVTNFTGVTADQLVDISGLQFTYNGGADTLNVDGCFRVRTVGAGNTYTFETSLGYGRTYTYVNNGATADATEYIGDVCEPMPYSFDVLSTYQGRLVLAHNSDKHTREKIYFSQTIDDEERASRFYQQTDPTSEEGDLVATDGGFIRVNGMGEVRQLLQFKQSLVAFADNGVWEIAPGEDGVFRADQYRVRQISNDGVTGCCSATVTPNAVFYWAEGGIYGIQVEQVSGSLQVENISSQTIQTLYNEIDPDARRQVRAAFSFDESRILWMYHPNGSSAGDSRTNVLGLDLALGAFFKWRFPDYDGATTTHKMVAPVNLFLTGTDYSTLWWLSDSDAGAKLLYLNDTGDYLDFGESELVPFLVTGQELLQDARKPKFSRYVHVYMESEDDSSCFAQGRWDFSSAGDSGKFGTKQQAYRPRSNHDNSIAKLSVRGTGRALSLRFEAEAGKPCNLQGWSVGYLAGARE